MTTDPEVAALSQWKYSHEDRCKERYEAIKDSVTDIKVTLAAMQIDLKAATQRLHERLDGVVKESARIDNRIDKEALKTMGAIIGAGIAIIVGMAKMLFGMLFK